MKSVKPLSRKQFEEKISISLAEDLGIKRTTAYMIIKSNRTEKNTQGGRQESLTKRTPQMEELLINFVEEIPLITLQQLKEKVNNVVSERTIGRILDGCLYSLKLARNEPVGRNTQENIEKRRQFCLDYQQELRRKVHLDECGYNLYTRRTQGRSRIGSRAMARIRNCRGKNINIILAVDDSGAIIHHEAYVGGAAAHFAEFMTELSALIGGEACVIYMDNAPIHRCGDNFIGVQQQHEIRRFDAPYSPQLNPVEGCFSVLKTCIKCQLREFQPELDAENAREAGQSLAAYREGRLLQLVPQSFQELTREKIRGFYREVDRVAAKCVAREPLQ